MLYKLLAGMNRDQFENAVISLTTIGPVGEKIQGLGIPVRALQMRPSLASLGTIGRLRRWLHQDAPDLLQTWMYHADLVGSLAAGRIPVIWNVRASALSPQDSKRHTRIVQRIAARFSTRLAQRIIFNSHLSQDLHRQLGYDAERSVVIPNGFDLELFQPNPAVRQAIREALGISNTQPVIGYVARFHPHKDHHNFIQAATQIHQDLPDVQFVLCGKDITPDNPTLMGWIRKGGIEAVTHLLGIRTDIPDLTTSFDLAVVASLSEAFPNVIGEAMACEVPCVVTDVGDSAHIVGELGRVVPPQNPTALAEACLEWLHHPPSAEFKHRLRQHILDHYSLPAIVQQYEALYRIAAQKRQGGDSLSRSYPNG